VDVMIWRCATDEGFATLVIHWDFGEVDWFVVERWLYV
jgi:hypothetical protein